MWNFIKNLFRRKKVTIDSLVKGCKGNMKIIYIIGIVFLITITTLVCTAGTMDKKSEKWEWRAGDYATRQEYQRTDYVCRHKVRDLGFEMKYAGEDFRVCLGEKSLEPHCWILYKGKILEPSQLSDHLSLYKTEEILTYDEFIAKWKKLGWN